MVNFNTAPIFLVQIKSEMSCENLIIEFSSIEPITEKPSIFIIYSAILKINKSNFEKNDANIIIAVENSEVKVNKLVLKHSQFRLIYSEKSKIFLTNSHYFYWNSKNVKNIFNN